MKKLLIILLAINTIALSQPRRHSSAKLSKFGMALGITANYCMPELEGINSELKKTGLPEFGKGLFTYGGSGYVYVLFVRNLRLGGAGYGGTSKVTAENRSATLSLSGGGITIEYTLPQIKAVALSFGVLLGGGKLTLDLYETKQVETWDEIWSDFNNGTQSQQHVNISSSYFLFAPTINTEVLLNRFVSLRIGGGYQFAVGESWKVYDDKDINNIPSNIGGSGLFFNAGILVGLFVF